MAEQSSSGPQPGHNDGLFNEAKARSHYFSVVE